MLQINIHEIGGFKTKTPSIGKPNHNKELNLTPLMHIASDVSAVHYKLTECQGTQMQRHDVVAGDDS